MNEAVKSAWNTLETLPKPALGALFAADAGRVGKLATRLELAAGGVLFDWSKTHLDDAHIAAFTQLADASGFAARRAALLSGEFV